MVTRRQHKTYWTESKRVVVGLDGEPAVKQVVCCCTVAAGTARECADARGLKTRCRCWCHSKRLK